MAGHKILIIEKADEQEGRNQLAGEGYTDIKAVVEDSDIAIAQGGGAKTKRIFNAVVLIGTSN